MYFMVTTRCNYLCAHCVGAYTADGEDMQVETASAFCNRYSEIIKEAGYPSESPITIGGGEPTINKDIVRIARILTTKLPKIDIFCISNGSRPEILAELDALGVRVLVSNTEWHQKFWKPGHEEAVSQWSERVITKEDLSYSGRAKSLLGTRYKRRESDACFSLGVNPNGDITVCTCREAPICGSVFGVIKIPEVVKREGWFCVSNYRMLMEHGSLTPYMLEQLLEDETNRSVLEWITRPN